MSAFSGSGNLQCSFNIHGVHSDEPIIINNISYEGNNLKLEGENCTIIINNEQATPKNNGKNICSIYSFLLSGDHILVDGIMYKRVDCDESQPDTDESPTDSIEINNIRYKQVPRDNIPIPQNNGFFGRFFKRNNNPTVTNEPSYNQDNAPKCDSADITKGNGFFGRFFQVK